MLHKFAPALGHEGLRHAAAQRSPQHLHPHRAGLGSYSTYPSSSYVSTTEITDGSGVEQHDMEGGEQQKSGDNNSSHKNNFHNGYFDYYDNLYCDKSYHFNNNNE